MDIFQQRVVFSRRLVLCYHKKVIVLFLLYGNHNKGIMFIATQSLLPPFGPRSVGTADDPDGGAVPSKMAHLHHLASRTSRVRRRLDSHAMATEDFDRIDHLLR